MPQTLVNVTGNVVRPGRRRVARRAALNGGGSRDARHPARRLADPAPGRLQLRDQHRPSCCPGNNFVELRATDAGGRVTTQNGHGQLARPRRRQRRRRRTARCSSSPRTRTTSRSAWPASSTAPRSAGRRVYVVIVTNGEGAQVEPRRRRLRRAGRRRAGRPLRPACATARRVTRIGVLGLTWSTNLNTTEIIFLGYPGGRLPDVASADTTPVTNSSTGVQRTYAEDFDANVVDLQRRLPLPAERPHSQFTRAGDARRPRLAARRSRAERRLHARVLRRASRPRGDRPPGDLGRRAAPTRPVRVHTTIHASRGRRRLHGAVVRALAEPGARRTTTRSRASRRRSTSPRRRPIPCDAARDQTELGPDGPAERDRRRARPRCRRRPRPRTRSGRRSRSTSRRSTARTRTSTTSTAATCAPSSRSSEFFWKYDFGSKRIWPKTYTTNWTSNDSIAQQAQILEGQWRYENGGVRPLTTGFDRALLIGDMGWTDYDVKAPFTINSFDPSTAAGRRGRPRARLAGPQRLGPAAPRPPRRRSVPLRARRLRPASRSSCRSATAPGPVDDTTLASQGQGAGDRRAVHDALPPAGL